jgi:hypothetical protein
MPIRPIVLPNTIDYNLREYLRQLADSHNQLESRLNKYNKDIDTRFTELDREAILNSVPVVDNPLAPQFINLTQQLAYVPQGTSTPDINDPVSRDGALFVLTDSSLVPQAIYRFDASTEPGVWEEVASMTSSNYFETNITTDVTANANSTAEQNLIQQSIAANALNDVAKVLRLYHAGLYTTQAGQTPTYRFRLKVTNSGGTTTLLDFTTAATTAAASNMFWQITAYVVPTGTGASATLECDGHLIFTLGTASAADSTVYQSIASPTLDLTVLNTFFLTVQISTQPATPFNVCTQRLLVTEILG